MAHLRHLKSLEFPIRARHRYRDFSFARYALQLCDEVEGEPNVPLHQREGRGLSEELNPEPPSTLGPNPLSRLIKALDRRCFATQKHVRINEVCISNKQITGGTCFA